MTDNTLGVSEHAITPTPGRYVRLDVRQAVQPGTQWPATRIFEFEAYGITGDVSQLPEYMAPDTAELEALIEEVSGLPEADHTAATWGKLVEARDAATALLARGDKTQDEVNAARDALAAARDGLVNVAELKAAIAKCDDLVESDYTAESWSVLEAARAEAEKLLADASATQEKVDDAVKKLDEARAGLKAPEPEVDKSALQAKYDEVKDLKADGYTADSWKAFESALKTAKTILESDKAGQADVDLALQMLSDAHAGLKKEEAPAVDKSKLDAAVKEAGELKADDYKTMSWNQFAKALAEAEAVLADAKADQAAVDAAARALADARAGLEEVERISFIDVVAETPHKGDIEWLAANGISTGWENADGTFSFRPYETVRRADMAAFLYRLAGEPELDADKAPAFADVDESTPHRDAILWLASEGISTGFEGADGKAEFRPYAEIARCDMAAFLYRMAGEPKCETDKGFADVVKDTPHRDAVLWLAETGVSEGWELEDGTAEFRPYDLIARADMAAFLQRMAVKDLVK